MKCTWKDCNSEALFDLIATDGNTWAHLCQEHYDTHNSSLNRYISEGGKENMKSLLRDWIKAQGGAEKASERL